MQFFKNFYWHKIADDKEALIFSRDGLIEINIHQTKLCIVFTKGKIFACSGKCPHAGGRLANGYVDVAGNIVCPLHCYKFNLQNGHNTTGEGYFLKTYPVEIRNEGVFVGIEENKLFSGPK